MRKVDRKKSLWVFTGVLITLFIWSYAWADFYVVASGKKAKKTILVSPKSTPTASGAALLNAVNGITGAGETNSYLVIIEPGVYDIGSSYLQMKEYVDIQGSGQKVTKITGTRSTEPYGVLVGANNAEVRFLTVENTGGGAVAIAILNSSASPRITNVTAIASGGTESAGIFNTSSAPVIRNVNATASGTNAAGGISNWESSSPIMLNVTATATGGTDTAGVSNRGSSSPIMVNIIASATGGTNSNNGVYNNASSPRMTNVSAIASGTATYNSGVNNEASSSPTMRNVSATSSGTATYNFGVNSKSSSSPVLINVSATASGGTNNLGVYTGESSTSRIDHSSIKGTISIITDSGCTTYVGSTMLDGAAVGSGTNKCVGAYDKNYDPLFDNCTMIP